MQDWALWLQFMRLSLHAHKLDDFLTFYRYKRNSKMRNRERQNPEVPRVPLAGPNGRPAVWPLAGSNGRPWPLFGRCLAAAAAEMSAVRACHWQLLRCLFPDLYPVRSLRTSR